MQPSDDPAGDRGPVVPIAPDPERDARVDAYRDRERRRATRALDRYIESVFVETPGLGMTAATVAGGRFVEAVGDYVLARLGERLTPDMTWDGPITGLHQKAHYDVADPGSHQDPRMHVKGCLGAFGRPCIPECGPHPICGDCAPGICPTPVKCGFTHPAPDHSATQRDLAHATMPHPTCQDVSRLDEGLGTRWVCTDRCPR